MKKLFNLRIFPALLLGVIVGICAVILIDTYAVAIAAAAVAAVLAAALFTAKKKRAA